MMPQDIVEAVYGDAEVQIWLGSSELPPNVVEEWRPLLDAEEQRRSKAFPSEKRQNNYVVRHAILRYLLGRELNVNGAELNLKAGPRGKLHLAESRLHFNLAHRGERFLIGISRRLPIGVDLEEIETAWTPSPGLVRDNFTAREARILSASPLAFWRGWTRKEACIKSTGHGLATPLTSFDVFPHPHLDLLVMERVGPFVISDLELEPPLVGAFALAEPA